MTQTISGIQLRPGEPGYDQARSVFNGDIDRRPAVIARCRSAADVAASVRHARQAGLELGVRGGGHGFCGARGTRGRHDDQPRGPERCAGRPVARLARCGGGATLADLDAATQAHGLAVTGGTISHTGVGGLTLGGGIGWLTGRCGLTVDNLVAADVVLADGSRCGPSPTSTPTCCGRSAVGAATSAWSPRSSSRCIRSARSCASGCCSGSSSAARMRCASRARSATGCHGTRAR